MKKTIYKITVMNWSKYNGKLKKGHGCILLSTGFLSDPKIRNLGPTTKLLYLSCLLVCGESIRSKDDLSTESVKSQFEVTHDSLVFQSGVKSGSLQSQLDQLQSLQLLSYEKIAPLINRREEKIKEGKRKKEKVKEEKSYDDHGDAPSKNQLSLADNGEADPPKVKHAKGFTKETWAAYRDEYHHRYGVDPIRSAEANSIIGKFIERVGLEDAPAIARFYVQHPSQFYHQASHPLTIMLRDVQKLRTEWATGQIVTATKARQNERSQTNYANFKEVIGDKNAK